MSLSEKDVNDRWTPLKACGVAALMLTVCGIFGSQIPKIYVEPGDAGLGARGLPIATVALMASLALVLLAINIPRVLKGFPGARKNVRWLPAFRAVALVVLAFVYVWLVTLFQYAVPTTVAMAIILAMFGNRGVARLVLVPIIAVLTYYFTFFVLLGLYEHPGKVLAYDSYSFSLEIRRFLGLQ